MTHTPGPWYVKQQEDLDPSGNGYVWAVKGKPESDKHYVQNPAYANSEANARLIAAAPMMLAAIEKAGRIVGQVQDNPRMSASERAYALSRASDALDGTYFKTTGKPLEWWQPEPAIAKAEEVTA